VSIGTVHEPRSLVNDVGLEEDLREPLLVVGLLLAEVEPRQLCGTLRTLAP
jgi:hypothetical protein